MFDFTGKTAVVTGGSRGIGSATVELFARLGADVSFNYYLNVTNAENLLQKIGDYPGKKFCDRCDVSNFADVERFLENVISRFGHIDFLVNNAGIWEYGAIDTMDALTGSARCKSISAVFFILQNWLSHI